MTNIKLHKNVLTVHNGASLSAVGAPRPIYTAKLSDTLSTASNRVSTIEDISSWQPGDVVVFTGPTNNLTSAPQRTITSIINNNVFTIDTAIDTTRTLATTPVYADHIFNLTRELQITGFTPDVRGAIRVLDAGKVNIKDVEFSNWGILGDTTRDGMVFASDSTNTSTIENCSLSGDFAGTFNFISYFPSFRVQGPSLFISNNIVHNVNGSALKIAATAVTPMRLSAVDNKFIVSNIKITGVSSMNTFTLSGNQFISSYFPAAIVDFRWLQSPIVQDEGYFGNRSYALSAANLIDMRIDRLTATFNDKVNQETIGSLYLTNCQNITTQSLFVTDNLRHGIHFDKVYHAAFLLDSFFSRNSYSNIKINTPNSLSLSAFNIINVDASDTINQTSINYTGSLNLNIDKVSACRNTYGLYMQYDGNATIVSEESPTDIAFTGPMSTSSTLIEDDTSFVVVPHNTKFAHDINREFTYEAYVKFNSVAGYRFIFDARKADYDGELFVVVENGTLRAGRSSYWPMQTTVVAEKWYHIALCRDTTTAATPMVRLFVDGVQIGTGAPDAAPYNSQQLYIGSRFTENYQLNGYISQVRVHQSALYPANPVPPRVNDNYTFTTNVILSATNSTLSGNNNSNIYMNNINSTIFLTPNIVNISDNYLTVANRGIQANNIAGNIERNVFASCAADAINVSVGNRLTLVNNNTAYLLLNRIVTTITDGLNYFPAVFNSNEVYSEGEFDLQPGGVGLYNREAPVVLTSWPGCMRIANPSQISLPRNSVAGVSFYTQDLDFQYLQIEFTGGTGNAWTLELYVDTVNKGTLVSTGTPTTQTFQIPATNAQAQFRKITIKFAKITAAEHGDISACIQNMKYSYDGVNFAPFDFAYLYYNAAIHYANIDPGSLTSVFGASPTFVFANINKSIFKKLHIVNTLNASIVPLYVSGTSGPILGSYMIEPSNVTLNTASVSAYYQENTEKSVGFALTDLPNISTFSKKGSIALDRSITINNQSNAPSEVLRPTNTNIYNKLKSAKKYITVSAGNPTKVYTFVKVSNTYNGTSPRLIVSQHAALGVESDRVLQTHSALPNTWQLLQGTVEASDKDGVLEFYVDCDGTAGYIAIDSWAAPI